MLRYAVIDTETGGLDPSRHPLMEVAYVLEGGTRVAYSVPFDVEDCDPRALEINGWGRREFAPELTVNSALRMMAQHFHKRLLVSSPAHFDMGFLGAFWARNTDEIPPWSHRAVIDLKTYACGVLGDLAPLGNGTIAARLGIEDTSDHSALEDAIYTDRMWRALVSMSQPELLGPRSSRAVFVSGKERLSAHPC